MRCVVVVVVVVIVAVVVVVVVFFVDFAIDILVTIVDATIHIATTMYLIVRVSHCDSFLHFQRGGEHEN